VAEHYRVCACACVRVRVCVCVPVPLKSRVTSSSFTHPCLCSVGALKPVLAGVKWGIANSGVSRLARAIPKGQPLTLAAPTPTPLAPPFGDARGHVLILGAEVVRSDE
jgi:hypothetical protein